MLEAGNHAHVLVRHFSQANKITVIVGRNKLLFIFQSKFSLPFSDNTHIEILNKLHDPSTNLLILFLIKIIIIGLAIRFAFTVAITFPLNLFNLRELHL